jgi:hypothetical protein
MLVELREDWQWPAEGMPQWSVVFIAADARGVPGPLIRAFAREMLRHDCTYVCAWGLESGRVHDEADSAYLEVTGADGEESIPFLMTTWHDDESLASALWFAFVSASPSDEHYDDGRYANEPTAFVAFASPQYVDEVRALLLNPERLDRESDDGDLIT